MKILIAPDSFKGSLTATEAAIAMATGIKEYNSSIVTTLLPVADGGEGTMSSLVKATGGKVITTTVHDPLGKEIEASYGILGDHQTCVIEIAEASGLTLLDEADRNPLKTTTFGTGELIIHALNKGLHNFIIGLGGSATNDAGAGILEALGMKLLDINGVSLPRGGGGLKDLHEIDNSAFDERIVNCHFVIASDVNNPLVGPAGASTVFGPQKGASSKVVKQLDENLTIFANVVEKKTGIRLHERQGAGAAGGTGAAFQAFFPVVMKRGIDVVLEAVAFDKYLMEADLVITGEGKTDAQTLSGKVPIGIAQEARKKDKPVILISGILAEDSRDLLAPFFTQLHAIVDEKVSQEQSLLNAAHYLQLKTKEVLSSWCK